MFEIMLEYKFDIRCWFEPPPEFESDKTKIVKQLTGVLPPVEGKPP